MIHHLYIALINIINLEPVLECEVYDTNSPQI